MSEPRDKSDSPEDAAELVEDLDLVSDEQLDEASGGLRMTKPLALREQRLGVRMTQPLDLRRIKK